VIQVIVEDLLQTAEVTADTQTRPDKLPGYSWDSSGQSQRRRYFHVDPSYFALQLSAYPYYHHPPQNTPVTNKGALSTFIRNLDRIPVTDTHNVGIIYVAPGQTKEADILRNTHGSPAYARFLDGIGRLVRLDGQSDVYTGGLNSAEDGVYGYAWWDDFFQVLYHTATLMPSDPGDPNSDKKKRHIGNDYVRIVWNDSGIPYRFDTLKTQFQFVNVVIEPHSVGSITAFSNCVQETEYFKVCVQRAASMPEFAPIGDFKLCSAAALPLYVRQLSLMSDWFASVFQRTNGDTDHVQLSTNWQNRLQAIKRFRKTIPVPDPPEFTSGVMAEVMQRDFTSVFY
jgi:tuberous sclerosis 2